MDSEKEKQPVDEELIMSIMAEGVRKPAQISPVAASGTVKQPAREKNHNRKVSESSYQERFLSSHKMVRRGDKSIYISQEYHERLSRIVQIIGEDKIALYAYLDNILEHHFELFEKAITDDFNEKYKPLF